MDGFDEYTNPLEQLLVVNQGLGRDPEAMLPEIDFAEALDATHEDANGELPYRSVPGTNRWELNPDYQQPRRTTVTKMQPSDFAFNPANIRAQLDREAAAKRKPSKREQMLARREALIGVLKDGPAAMPVLKRAAPITTSQLYSLLATLQREGLIRKVGNTRPAVWALAEQATALETVDEPAAARGRGDAPDEAGLRERYLRILAGQHPERLLALLHCGKVLPEDLVDLIESGKLAPEDALHSVSPLILDALDAAVLGWR